MRLQDAVATAQPLVLTTSDGRQHLLQGARELHDPLYCAPLRFVLDDDAAALVSQTAFAPSSPLGDSLDLIRAPSTSLWVEWNEAGRCSVLRELGLETTNDNLQMRGRAGALITADDSGRRGVIDSVWENSQGMADRSPYSISFDLDVADFSETPGPTKASRKIRMQRHSWMQPLFDRVRFDLDDGWRDYYLRYSRTREEFERALNQSIQAISSDMPLIASMFLVLGAKGALRQTPVHYDRLNEARRKRGKPALLDHLSVSLDIGEDESAPCRSFYNARGEARLHHVCGHLVRRNGSIFWRRAHLRGNPQLGLISSKTIEIKAPAFNA